MAVFEKEDLNIGKKSNKGKIIFLVILILIVIGGIITILLLNIQKDTKEEIIIDEENQEKIIITSDIFNIQTENMENYLNEDIKNKILYEKLSDNIKECKNTHVTFKVPDLEPENPLFKNPSGELIIEKLEDDNCLIRQINDFVVDCKYAEDDLLFVYNNLEIAYLEDQREILFGPSFYLINYLDIQTKIAFEFAKEKVSDFIGIDNGGIKITSWDKTTEINLKENLMAEKIIRTYENKKTGEKITINCFIY